MGWARLDDSFHDHPKLIGLSLEALGLWTKCFTWAHRHHGSGLGVGHLPTGLPESFAGSRGRKLGNELVTHGLWDVADSGWVIHDYADYLPASEKPQTAGEVRKSRSEAGRKGAEARWGKADEWQADGKLLSDLDGKPMPPNPTRPEPDQLATDVARNTPSNVDALFDQAYLEWPKKVERKAALAKFKLAAKRLGAEALAGQVIRFGRAYAATTERQFVPALGVWLSHERWTDDLPTAAQRPTSPAKLTRVEENIIFTQQLQAAEAANETDRWAIEQ
jgi:hypothetical protein